jgi:formate dehydrogenase major subunit
LSVITINNKQYEYQENQTILDVCNTNNVFIPTLCHLSELEPYGSCFVCVVEVMKGRPGIYPACSTNCAEGMIVETENAKVKSIRKMALELLMSDHFGDCVAPCTLQGCPADINIQGFLDLESEGRYKEAAQLIRQKAPMPNILGRVCPAPCEKVCRRKRVDEAISIRIQKRYISDKEIEQGGPFILSKGKSTYKNVSIIGAGPAGISSAYFLALSGHNVTIYETQPQHGGMLRYGIPAYRMPRDIIDIEFDAIINQLGIKVLYNTKVGKDISFTEIEKKSDAVLVSIGAQISSEMNIKGENSKLVIPAVKYLESVSKGKDISLGKSTVVVGGGHTAMDVARTAVRKGIDTIVLYRRSKDEMPAKDEIMEALQEGVVFQFLSAPIECKQENKRLIIECIQMDLSEPDASGRRKPIPKRGSETTIVADTMVMAIGQKVEIDSFTKDICNERGFLQVDKNTFQTSHEKVFSAGDCVTGPDLVVTAVAAGRKVAVAINEYLLGKELQGEKPIFSSVTDDLNYLPEEMFASYTKEKRMQVPEISLSKKRSTFETIELPVKEEDMIKEAKRCLYCGCVEINDCKLKEYSEIYRVDLNKFKGEKRTFEKDATNEKVVLENDKCINCSSCIRIAESMGNNKFLGMTQRGFSSRVKPPFQEDMRTVETKGWKEVAQRCPTAGIRIANKRINNLDF